MRKCCLRHSYHRYSHTFMHWCLQFPHTHKMSQPLPFPTSTHWLQNQTSKDLTCAVHKTVYYSSNWAQEMTQIQRIIGFNIQEAHIQEFNCLIMLPKILQSFWQHIFAWQIIEILKKVGVDFSGFPGIRPTRHTALHQDLDFHSSL